MLLRNGVLIHGDGPGRGSADAAIRVGWQALLGLLSGQASTDELEEGGGLTVDGPPDALGRLLGVLDAPDPGFAIITP